MKTDIITIKSCDNGTDNGNRAIFINNHKVTFLSGINQEMAEEYKKVIIEILKEIQDN